MAASAAVILTHLKKTHPFPEPDLLWVEACIAALVADGQTPTLDAVYEQYLYADLASSTLDPVAGDPTSIPSPGEDDRLHNVILFPRPVLFQVHTLNEIGSSAFQLKTALEARRDVLSGTSRIRRMDDEDDDEQLDADKNKVPPYPHSMLTLDVSDGRTALRAIEYRHIPGLLLGGTPLGLKIQLQNVRCLRGTLLLSPANCKIIGGAVEALQAEQAAQFSSSIEDRLAAARETAAAGPKRKKSRARASQSTGNAAAPSTTARAPAVTARAQGSTSSQSSAAARAARLAAIEAAQAQDHAQEQRREQAQKDDDGFDDDWDIADELIAAAETFDDFVGGSADADSFIEEAEYVQGTSDIVPHSGGSGRTSAPVTNGRAGGSKRTPRKAAVEPIMLNDSEDEDYVPSRGSTRGGRRTSRSPIGQPVVTRAAKRSRPDPTEVIDICDSD